ncbi:DUF2281 domain-containing protein [Pedobacter aquatilis]|uniref:DUF2281 domain-containing protein n=1 Tax=Pedobacter aquatilis TaxID=351343 RepID=UPI00292FDF71|nr:DUF2281 domain-containing protein [Pedobacter aquatilis]
MSDFELYSEISSLPSDLKKEVSDFVAFLKQKEKKKKKSQEKLNQLKEPLVHYGAKFSEFLLKGPVFSDAQIQKIDETRKSINEWRTR